MITPDVARLRQLGFAEAAWRMQGIADIALRRAAASVSKPRWDRHQLAGRLRFDDELTAVRRLLAAGDWSGAHRALSTHFVAAAPRFVISPSLRSTVVRRIEERFPNSANDASRAAERLVEGRYDVLGYRDLRFDGRSWHTDHVHRKDAPLAFWSQVPYLNPDCGDHKIIWELNRHQQFLQLGRAYWLNADARYREEFIAQLKSWIAANPPRMGINWASMLELAFRCLSWVWGLHFFADAETSDGEPWTVDLLLALDEQLAHVERHLSYYFSPNTHLLGEALALYVVGRTVPELRASARREATGRRILLQESTRQVEPDGGHAERSAHYHRYTLDFYLLALAVARITDDPIAPMFEKTCARLGHAARVLSDDGGRLPHLGDDDGGSLLPIAQRAPDDCRDSLAIAAALTGHTDLLIGSAPEELYWLLAHDHFSDAVARVTRSNVGVAIASTALPSTGYYVSRTTRGDHLVIDGGPHGYMNAGHAHADALSLTFTRRHKPLLIDTGTGCYTIDAAMRDRFRSSAYHNTVTLDDRSQSLPRGPFHWAHVATTTVQRWHAGAHFDYFAGAHDGYAPVVHQRHVLMLHDDLLIVLDTVDGDPGRHRAAVHWHLDPAWAVGVSGARALLSAGDESIDLVTNGHLEQFVGDTRHELGWHSPAYGRVEPATTLRIVCDQVLPIRVVTAFGLDAANHPVSVVMESDAIVRVDRVESVDRWNVAELDVHKMFVRDRGSLRSQKSDDRRSHDLATT